MYRLSAESVAINQATRKGLVIRVILDNLTLKNADEDFVERETINLCLFISVVGNPYSVVSYCVNDVFNIHLVLPFKQVTKDAALLPLFYHSTLRFRICLEKRQTC